MEFPVIDSEVFHTPQGVPYLKGPGVGLLAQPTYSDNALRAYLGGFPPNLEFMQYLDDPVKLQHGVALAKVAGQLCYQSFGPKRTMNADASKYFKRLKEQAHGSVIQHPVYSLLIWGVSRSLTHEAIRHSAGWAYSQISQRYVSGETLRFVERPEYQHSGRLHAKFIRRIEWLFEEYRDNQRILTEEQESGLAGLQAESPRDQRKKVNEAARSCLPNETETALVATGNIRALRHFFEMRVSRFAEREFRNLGNAAFEVMKPVAPEFLEDYTITELRDGSLELTTLYRKV